MINVKYYLDKADKSKRCPIHLVIRQKDVQIIVDDYNHFSNHRALTAK